MSSMILPGKASSWTRMDKLHAYWRRRFNINLARVAVVCAVGYIVAITKLSAFLGGGGW